MQLSRQEMCRTECSLRWFFSAQATYLQGESTPQSALECCCAGFLIRAHPNFLQNSGFLWNVHETYSNFSSNYKKNPKPKPHTDYFPSLFMYLIICRKAWDLELDLFHSVPLKAALALLAHVTVHKRWAQY